MEAVLSSREEMDKRIYTFPTSQILLHGRKSSYYDVIDSLQFEACNEALLRCIRRIDWEKTEKLINEVEMITPVRKQFYLTMLRERYDKLLAEPYRKLTGEKMD